MEHRADHDCFGKGKEKSKEPRYNEKHVRWLHQLLTWKKAEVNVTGWKELEEDDGECVCEHGEV
jgi:hypothetical protein